MLRSAKSLPSLRALASPGRCAGMPHKQVRLVHQTTKKDATPLLNSKKSEFSLMSLQTLKAECRKRGLKVSGRKAELVSRVANHEASFSTRDNANMSTMNRPALKTSTVTAKMSFNSSSKALAKGDDSHIDFIKPVDLRPEPLVRDDYIVKIPSISTEASKNPVTPLEKELQGFDLSSINSTVFSTLSNTKVVGSMLSDFLHLESKAEEEEYVEKPYEYDNSEIPNSDKTFFAAFAGITALWFFLKPTEKKEH
ncbi:unnamed protein product [Cyberlindnera jadinii]|uniref:SAP domain-containing protein n=2 Tax=Cyberlindnera jadinii (strain ATCC 18201 / CBS 1600 / BCRC 20928 / JCM 3617 / NBRC 0987 / NRRL Y-1542) TaxID=983966 RepID=A0A0H5C749_CYBJN|nr:unnamed protein product [Cyberlindnera jadinii]